MLNFSLPLLLLALAGCSEEPAPPKLTPQPPTPKEEVQSEEQVEEVQTAAPVDEELSGAELPESLFEPGSGLEGFDRARSLTAARKYREAVPELLSLLMAKDSKQAWTLLRWTSTDKSTASQTVDQLSPDQALSDAVSEHHRTRAMLALMSDRNEDAAASSELLMSSDAESGSVAMARAILAGAKHPNPRALDAASPEDALVMAAMQPARKRADLLSAAASLESWQAKVLIAAMSPDMASVLAAAEQVPKAPEAHLSLASMLLQRSDLALGPIATHLAAGARAADELGLGEQSLSLGQAAIDAHLQSTDSAAALALGQELLQGRLSAGDGDGGAQLSAKVVEAGLRSGDLRAALEAARLGERMGELSEQPEAHAAAAWGLARAAYAAAQEKELERAVSLLKDSPALARAQALLASHQGQPAPKALRADANLSPAEASWLERTHARALLANAEPPEPAFQAAVAAADRDGSPDLRLRARLEWQQLSPSASSLKSLAQLAQELELPALDAEVAARTLMAGGTFEAAPELDPSWASLADSSAEPAEGAVSAFAEAHRLALSGDAVGASTAFRDAYSSLPVYRVGPWASLSVQDGAQGVDMERDASTLLKLGAGGVPGLLALHDYAHARASMQAAFFLGDDPAASLPVEQALDLRQAYAAVQVDTLAWLLGGAKPDAAEQALAERHSQAMEVPGFARALPAPQPELGALKEALGSIALVSIRLGRNAEVLAIAGDTMSSHGLRDSEAVERSAVALRQALAEGDTQLALQIGNGLRETVIDPMQQTLSGKGQYLLLVDGTLSVVSPAVFPESQEGLRYLADIRSINLAGTSAQAMLPKGRAPSRYVPEFLALSAMAPEDLKSADGSPITPEVVQVSHRFEKELRVVLQGDEPKLQAFAQSASKARFIHLVPDSVGPHGALVFGDELLTLDMVRAQDLSAVSAILSVDMSPQLSERWVQALRAAGVVQVVVRSWTVEPSVRSKFFFSSYEGLIQHGNPGRAFQQARKSMAAEQMLLGDDGPTWWGAYLAHGHL